MNSIKLKFEFGGKTYEADAKGWVKLPDGTQLKVTATDTDGNATVEKNGKKGIADADIAAATEVVAPEPEVKTEPETKPEGVQPTQPTLADLKVRWEAAVAAIATAKADQEAVESLIAVALVKAGEGKKEKPAVRLGIDNFKAQRSKDNSAPPRLIKLAPVGEILG